jgi:hypothetical protein
MIVLVPGLAPIDEHAQLRCFDAVDRSVFSPLKRSLRLSPVAGA